MLSKLKNRRSSKGLYKISLLIVLIVVLMISNLPASQAVAANAPDLFVGADQAAADLLYDSPDFVPRHRYVNVNLGLLFDQHGNSLDAKTTPEITLNLFPDTDYVGLVENVETDPDASSTWYGSLKGVEGSYFYLVVTEGVFIAHIASTEGIYEVSWVADNLYRVVEIDQSKLGECALDEIEPVDETSLEESAGSTAEALATLADSAATIDVIVFYTDDARLGEGSTAAMNARIQLAMQETNGSYANSGVQPRLRLVHVEEVSYAETGNIFTDVNRLQNTSDGYIDHIHNLRKKYGADMVALIVENGGGYCGVAKSTYANTQNAFQVTTRSGCMTGYYSFGHEFGHLQGARHDVYVDTSAWPYTFGHGYVHTHATTLSKRWRTVMAYNNKCSDLGYNCTRLQWWSNGNKQYLGASMGDNKAQNFRVLNATAYNIANLVKQKIGNNFNSSFNTNSNGWQSVFGRWSLSQSMYFKTTGAANKGTSIRHSNSYGDLTYRVKMKRTGSCKSCATRLIIRGNPDRLRFIQDLERILLFPIFEYWQILRL